MIGRYLDSASRTTISQGPVWIPPDTSGIPKRCFLDLPRIFSGFPQHASRISPSSFLNPPRTGFPPWFLDPWIHHDASLKRYFLPDFFPDPFRIPPDSSWFPYDPSWIFNRSWILKKKPSWISSGSLLDPRIFSGSSQHLSWFPLGSMLYFWRIRPGIPQDSSWIP